MYSLFWMIPRRLNFMCRRFGTLCSIFMDRTTYEDGAECSEMSAHKTQNPGNHPKERKQHSEHGKSLEPRMASYLR